MPQFSFQSFSRSASTLGTRMRVAVPGAQDLEPIAKTVTHLTGGDITIVPLGNPDDEPISFTGVAAGWIAPCVVRRITAATGSVATVEG
jgi:hypothetical protein